MAIKATTGKKCNNAVEWKVRDKWAKWIKWRLRRNDRNRQSNTQRSLSDISGRKKQLRWGTFRLRALERDHNGGGWTALCTLSDFGRHVRWTRGDDTIFFSLDYLYWPSGSGQWAVTPHYIFWSPLLFNKYRILVSFWITIAPYIVNWHITLFLWLNWHWEQLFRS